MIKTLLFDIDNTLYDFKAIDSKGTKFIADYFRDQFGWEEQKTKALYKEKMNEQLEYLGFHNASIHNRQIRIQMMLEEAGLPLYPHVINAYEGSWNAILDAMIPYEGAIDFMKDLKAKGITIGIGTDMTSEIQYKKLERLGAIELIDYIVTSEEAGFEKPHIHFFDLCLKKAGVNPNECLMLGDNWAKDMEGAIRAGMKYLWYHPEELKPEEEDRRDHVVRNYKELREKIGLV